MKKLLFILSLFITSISYGQSTPDTVFIKIKSGGGTIDSLNVSKLNGGKIDTSHIPISIVNIAQQGTGYPMVRGSGDTIYSKNIKAGTNVTLDSSDGGVKINVAAGGSGTVTSVAKGYGILADGTITTTGTVTVDSSGLSNYYPRRKDSTVSFTTPYQSSLKQNISDSTTKYVTPTQIKVKYDSTQFVIATIGTDSLQTSGALFSSFNGGTSTYDAANYRISGKGLVAGKGVQFSKVMIAGHKYTAHVNVTGMTGAGNLSMGFNSPILMALQNGDNYVTFVAPTAGTYGNKLFFLIDSTFYINYVRIQEVPLNFEYATKGDVYPILSNYAPIVANTNARQYINVSTSIQLGQGASVGNASSVVAGQGASAAATETGSIAVGQNAKSYVDPTYGTGGGGEVAIGMYSIAGAWRATSYGGYSQALAVSTTALGYGTYVNQPHGSVFNRGGYNTLGGVLFYHDLTAGGNNVFYFGSQDAAHTNPAMPGGETTDFSAGLNAGTTFVTLKGPGGVDTKPTPTLTNTRGGTVRIAGGASTGTAAGGDVELAVTPATGSSNNITNPDSVIIRVSALRQSVAIGNIGNTKPTPDTSAKLDVQSLTKGFLMPRMTSTQRLAIVLPATGLMVYDLTIKREVDYDGANWNYSPKVFTGTAAPATTPLAVGDDFIDTTNKKAYKAMGTSSSSDWVILN